MFRASPRIPELKVRAQRCVCPLLHPQAEESRVLEPSDGHTVDAGDVVRSVMLWRAGVSVVSAAQLPNMDFGGMGRSDPCGEWAQGLSPRRVA